MLRSRRSVKSDSFSTPTTSTWRALPERTMSEASPTPCEKPAQAADRSKAMPDGAPIAAWTSAAVEGKALSGVEVATITASTSAAGMPACSSARRAAAAPIEEAVSPSAAICRRRMPVRSRIHSSEVSSP